MSHPDVDRDQVKHMSEEVKEDLNADPITGEPGAHPVATGLGSAGGAAAGAAIGAIGGPLGMLIGGAIGAIAGGMAGSAAGEAVDPTFEEAYWREQHVNTDYYHEQYDYDTDYHPAYAVGYAMRNQYPKETTFEEVETQLQRKWEEVKGNSTLAWDIANKRSKMAGIGFLVDV